jgi:hypothetical protein
MAQTPVADDVSEPNPVNPKRKTVRDANCVIRHGVARCWRAGTEVILISSRRSPLIIFRPTRRGGEARQLR